MSFIIIIGIVLIAIGSFITYAGSKKDSDKSQQEINYKLDSFNKKLDTVSQSNLSSIDKQKKVEKIKSEFDGWAKDLIDNYSELELSHEKKVLENLEIKLEINKIWSPIFSKAFFDLIQMVESVNKNIPSNKISIHSSNAVFPKDIFSDEAKTYCQIFGFKEKYFLRIRIYLQKSVIQIPTLYLTLHNDLDQAKKDFNAVGELSMNFLSDNKFYLHKNGTFNLFKFNSANEENIGDYPRYPISEITDFFKAIIQYQFVVSNKK